MNTVLIVGSFFFGVIVGAALRDAFNLYSASRKEDEHMHLPHPHLPRVDWLRTAFFSMLVVNAVLAVILIVQRADSEDAEKTANETRQDLLAYSTCLTKYQEDFITAYKARVDVSTEVSRAIDRTFRAVKSGDVERIRAAFDHYLAVRDSQIAEQAENPLPDLPTEVCGLPPEDLKE